MLTTAMRDAARVMQVRIDGDEKSYPCAVAKTAASLQPGTIVYVEFGATWATVRGRQQRIGGQWRRCQTVKVDGNVLHVRSAPDA